MKKIILLFCVMLSGQFYAQNIRFNKNLNKFCETALKDTAKISPERKKILHDLAATMANKKAIVFTCKTNTRRTQLLQTWAQTSFYYYSILNKTAFSIGDTLSEIHPTTVKVLKKSGFILSESRTKPKAYVFFVGEKMFTHAIYPKKILKATTDEHTLIVSICFEGEPNSAIGTNAISLPYESPKKFDNSPEEEAMYIQLNKQIATEMLFLGNAIAELRGSDYR